MLKRASGHVALCWWKSSTSTTACTVLYTRTLPMCHCSHVKDKLPQLSYKNTFTHQWKDRNSVSCSAFINTHCELQGLTLWRPPHSQPIMYLWELTPDKASCVFTLCTAPLNTWSIGRVPPFKALLLAATQFFETFDFSTTAFQFIYTLQFVCSCSSGVFVTK